MGHFDRVRYLLTYSLTHSLAAWCCDTGRPRRRVRRAPLMPRATTSPTAGASPIESSTPSVEEAPPVQVPTVDAVIPAVPALPVRKPPTALNLSQPRHSRRKKSIMSMPRVLPSPTVPLLHRIPGSINFPRLAGSPTPPSLSSSTDDEAEARSSPPLSASRRSFPADWDAAARRRLLSRRDSDDRDGETTLRRRTFEDRTTDGIDADSWHGEHGDQVTGKRQLPYVDSLPRDAVIRSLLWMPTSRPGTLSRSRSRSTSRWIKGRSEFPRMVTYKTTTSLKVM